MDFYDVVRTRQSIRQYKADPVPEETLARVLEAFRAAPSWANVQPWELVVVRDPAVKEALQKTLPPGNPATHAIVEAPLLVCVIGISGISGWYKGKPSTARGDWMLFDLGIATEHLALAAAAEGLGTVHVALFDFEKAGEVLNVRENRSVVELVPLGFPARTPRVVPRKPLEEFVFKDSYGQKYFAAPPA